MKKDEKTNKSTDSGIIEKASWRGAEKNRRWRREIDESRQTSRKKTRWNERKKEKS